MNIKQIAFFSFLALLFFASCRKNIDEVTTTETPYVPPIIESWVQPLVIVEGSLTGFVVDESGQPLVDADVNLGGKTTKTDAFGHFFYKDIDLNARGTLVQVSKDGFFPGSRRFFAVEDAENRVRIQMITKSFNHNFDAQNGGVVEMNGGATVNFPPNSIQKSDGTIYEGTVRVAAKWLDPENLETLDEMPGNLQGVNSLAEEVVLGTAGMMAVELQSSSGEKLNILEGKTARISMPVPSTLQNPPVEIPNWSYNEEHGMWVEEGVSILQGDFYVGEVSHFSYWNHDFKDPLIEFTARITNQDGFPLDNYRVVIRQEGTGLYGYGHTCDRGIISGLIPQDYDLIMEVLGVCNEVLYSQNIGPYSDDINLGDIAIDESVLMDITISGELVDCDGNPVSNGVTLFEFDGQTIYEYTNGQAFSVILSTCVGTENIEVKGVDLDDLFQSDVNTVVVANGDEDLGEISVCDQQLTDYIRLDVDGDVMLYMPASIYVDVDYSNLSFMDSLQNTYMYFNFAGTSTGSYGGTDNWIEFISDTNNNWVFEGDPFSTFEVTEFGNVGEQIKGNFEGILNNWGVQPSVQVNVTGDFSITRTN